MAGFQEDLGVGPGTNVTPKERAVDRSTSTLINAVNQGINTGLEMRDASILAEVDEENRRLEALAQQKGSSVDVRTRAEKFARSQAARAPHLASKINSSLRGFLSTSSTVSEQEMFQKIQIDAVKRIDPTGAIALTAVDQEDYMQKGMQYATDLQKKTENAKTMEQKYMGTVAADLNALFKSVYLSGNPAEAQRKAAEYKASKRGALVASMIEDGVEPEKQKQILSTFDSGIEGYSTVMSGISTATAAEVSNKSSQVQLDTMEYYQELMPLRELVGEQAFGNVLSGFVTMELAKVPEGGTTSLVDDFQNSVQNRMRAQIQMNNTVNVLKGEHSASDTSTEAKADTVIGVNSTFDSMEVATPNSQTMVNGLTYLNDSARTLADSENWMNSFQANKRAKLLQLSQIHPDKEVVQGEARKVKRHAEKAITNMVNRIGNGSTMVTELMAAGDNRFAVRFVDGAFVFQDDQGNSVADALRTVDPNSLVGSILTSNFDELQRTTKNLNNAYANLRAAHQVTGGDISPEGIARSIVGGRLDVKQTDTKPVRRYDPATGTFSIVE